MRPARSRPRHVQSINRSITIGCSKWAMVHASRGLLASTRSSETGPRARARGMRRRRAKLRRKIKQDKLRSIPGTSKSRYQALSLNGEPVPEFHFRTIWAVQWRNWPRLWLFQMVDVPRPHLLEFRVLPVPIRTKPNPCNTRLLYTAFAAWLIASSAALAQPSNVPAPPEPTGEWLVGKQVARIKIADCDGRMWGVVSWEAQPGDRP